MNKDRIDLGKGIVMVPSKSGNPQYIADILTNDELKKCMPSELFDTAKVYMKNGYTFKYSNPAVFAKYVSRQTFGFGSILLACMVSGMCGLAGSTNDGPYDWHVAVSVMTVIFVSYFLFNVAKITTGRLTRDNYKVIPSCVWNVDTKLAAISRHDVWKNPTQYGYTRPFDVKRMRKEIMNAGFAISKLSAQGLDDSKQQNEMYEIEQNLVDMLADMDKLKASRILEAKNRVALVQDNENLDGILDTAKVLTKDGANDLRIRNEGIEIAMKA